MCQFLIGNVRRTWCFQRKRYGLRQSFRVNSS
nr:MAG TPA: hypothetical protein [Bacteriophage sp.]